MVRVGIIGGTGLDDPKLIKRAKKKNIKTKYGKPSSQITTGKIRSVEVAILARHGKGHTIWPTLVNFRANIAALKKLRCTHILATTACGSLREKIKPGDLIVSDQFIDFTKHRNPTFHDQTKQGEVLHLSIPDPFCPYLGKLLYKEAKKLKLKCHRGATVITIEGPRLSTRAESHMFRSWGADIINMSTVPEVILAREAKLCYAVVAMSTDYDSWKEDDDPVTWDMIKTRMKQNAEDVKQLLLEVIPKIEEVECTCKQS
jgi:5'-methylthioadenosine phosphorylase